VVQLVPNVEVHSGFLKQFQSLALNPVEGGGESCMDLVPNTELLRAVCNLTQGAEPLRIVSSGFSLGGALSELAGVWASQMWPTADILVANQGEAGGDGRLAAVGVHAMCCAVLCWHLAFLSNQTKTSEACWSSCTRGWQCGLCALRFSHHPIAAPTWLQAPP
jgi:hypothetical protein